MDLLRSKNVEELEKRIAELEQQNAYTQALLLTMANSAYNALIIMNEDCGVLAINNQAKVLFPHEHPVNETLENLTGSPEISMMVSDTLTNREDVLEEQISIQERVYKVKAQVIMQDNFTFICLAFEDITDLVRLNRARRDMVANISHELRTPIANIRLIIDDLFLETERPKRKKSINSLRAIGQETDALLWMADELLDLSMIESGQAIIRMVEEPVQQMVEEAIERIYDQSAAKELDVVHDVAPDCVVLCDHDKIRRVLANLIHNAVKWSPPGETISIHAKREGDEVMISVFDNGPGVPEGQSDRIFERFYQADASRSVSDGTGLGLAICKHIIEAHGGRIWAEDNSEQSGGRFFFLLAAGESNS